MENNQQSTPMIKPDSNLVWAILTTLICCLPFGVVAIVKACKVDSLWAIGLYQEAVNASNEAKKWSIIAAVTALVGYVIYILCLVIGLAYM